MHPRVKNWSYNRLTKPHEVDKIIEIVNPEIVSIESNNDGKLIRPDGSNDKISFKSPPKKTLEGNKKGEKKRLILKKKIQTAATIVTMKNQKNQEKDLLKDYWKQLKMKKKMNILILKTM